jgi:hypothetical protein
MAHAPVGAGGGRARRRLLVRGGDFSCEAETYRGIPLAGNWSETLLTGRNRDVLPVWVLTRVLVTPQVFNYRH